MITRRDYVNSTYAHSNDATSSHRKYYAQFVTCDILQVVEETFGYEALADAYYKDRHLLSIEIQYWDAISTTQKELFNLELLRKAGEGWSLSTGVCILKEAAKQIVESRIH